MSDKEPREGGKLVKGHGARGVQGRVKRPEKGERGRASASAGELWAVVARGHLEPVTKEPSDELDR